MKILLLLLTSLALGFSESSHADDIAVGSVTCKEWIIDRASKADYLNKDADQSWVIGFLSAYSEATRINFLDNIKLQSIYTWMDKYCANHPLAQINDGALILANGLIRKMKK
jgi:hypothetical protein